jgi:hypothetical protein
VNDQPLSGLSEENAIDLGRVSDLSALLRAIDEAMPDDAVLYVEGTTFAPAVADLLGDREVTEKPLVERGTIWPKPRVFHLPLTGTNLAELRSLAEEHAAPEVAGHLVVYRGSEVLLEAYDAGGNHVLLSRTLPPETVKAFRAALE